MPERAMSGPDPSKTPSSPAGLREQPNTKFETDLADLAARFSAQSGGGLSPELSADLALEIVLNEIVEQACLATGATGAAIVLERDGEMVCRASSGSTAPELGSRLDTSSGLSGECFKTQRTQWCDDAMSDRRVDVAASERLGVRSVVVMPLLREGKIVGVIELFSSQPYAFGVRDERTLEVLADRTLNNLDHAAHPLELQKGRETTGKPQSQTQEKLPDFSGRNQSDKAHTKKDQSEKAHTENASRENTHAEKRRTVRDRSHEGEADESKDGRRKGIPLSSGDSYKTSALDDESSDRRDARSEADASGWMLGAAALACAILLGLVVSRHWGARNTGLHARPRSDKSAVSAGQPVTPKGADDSSAAPSVSTKPAQVSPGSLRVLENGREVFRMPPKGNQPAAADQAVGVQRASSLEPDGVMELSPAAAEGSLLERVEPDYPESAREQKIRGTVVLEVHIAADGTVQDVQVMSGPPVLAQAGIEAVKQWKFKPRLVKGSPVEMQTRITLNFRLPQ